ncbi:GtrA family protein [Pullulanibacillus sp. KACC 23026]|uniref:GtrA family protein n=1 Tax=Pullulanibacillus sp. KACC 23026 TaxID=3028315 RepID=UPI0023AF3399|nr:GtrA family protein [Pullulanibacillus sp. KACC 23026]WEG13728.1 GtrA family protein [Pullulanibacillus sp. KACC 23026]
MKQGFIKGLIQYIKFGSIGLTSGALDLGSLNLMLWIWPTSNHLLLVVFNTFAYALAVLNSYIWNSRFTFREGLERSHKQRAAFIIQAVVSLLISDGVLYIATLILSIGNVIPRLLVYNIAKLLSMFLSSLASFFFMKYFVFREKKMIRRKEGRLT